MRQILLKTELMTCFPSYIPPITSAWDKKVCRRFSRLSLDASVVLCRWELEVRKATVVDGQCGVTLFELREFTVNDLRRKNKDREAPEILYHVLGIYDLSEVCRPSVNGGTGGANAVVSMSDSRLATKVTTLACISLEASRQKGDLASKDVLLPLYFPGFTQVNSTNSVYNPVGQWILGDPRIHSHGPNFEVQ